MRRRKTDLPARVKSDLVFAFRDDVHLTSYAGLDLFNRYLRGLRFNTLVRHAFAGAPSWSDFGAVAMVRVLIGLLVVGGRRLDHVAYVQDDPLMRRFCQLQVLPTARTISRWLKAFTMRTVERLRALNAAVIAQVIPGLRLHTVTVDVDGVVVSTGLQVERAFRGFNPHHRKVPIAPAEWEIGASVATLTPGHGFRQSRRVAIVSGLTGAADRGTASS